MLGRLRQEDCKSQASLGYKCDSHKQKHTKWISVAIGKKHAEGPEEEEVLFIHGILHSFGILCHVRTLAMQNSTYKIGLLRSLVLEPVLLLPRVSLKKILDNTMAG